MDKVYLENHINKIAKALGAIDVWIFKRYLLVGVFYRFLSEDFIDFFNKDDIDYLCLRNSKITEPLINFVTNHKGYFIYPKDLFHNVIKTSKIDIDVRLTDAFIAIENSAKNFLAEKNMIGLFDDFDINNNSLGSTREEKNTRLFIILQGVADLKIDDFFNTKNDILGDIYEFLLQQCASNAGKAGGEFYTPQPISKLVTALATHKNSDINKVYDPTCGSGSLLLQIKKYLNNENIEYFGQEINYNTHNLAKMNMFLHNINYTKFNIKLGNTLTNPHFGSDKPFDAIVSNPPYSVQWVGSDDPTLINDDRFSPAGVLAPKAKADFAFILHALNYLSNKGRAVIVCFPGIFYRGGAEQKIRQYLIDNNYVESVIELAPRQFYGTDIAVEILVLAKNKQNTDIQFINASSSEFFEQETNNNVMRDEHIKKIIDIFDSKQDIAHIARLVPYEEVASNNYMLSVKQYIDLEDDAEAIDIVKLNKEIEENLNAITKLHSDINTIIMRI